MSDDTRSPYQFIPCRGPGERYPFSEEVLRDALDAYAALDTVRKKVDALLDVVAICRSAGRVDFLLAFLEKACRDPLMSPARADILCRMGEACEEDGRYDDALKHYLASMEFDTPNDSVRYARLTSAAYCCLMKGNPMKAEELCKSAIVLDPEQWQAWKNLGIAAEALDDPREAAQCYARAIKLSHAHLVPIVHLRELVKRRGEVIGNLGQIRRELMDRMGVLV